MPIDDFPLMTFTTEPSLLTSGPLNAAGQGGTVLAADDTLAALAELLAPAGDHESLRAAVANGADAVYFGLAEFNARHRAANFTLADLPDTIQFLHARGVRAYVAFNTLIFSDELPHAAELIEAVVRAGADAFIVQDLGLVGLIHRIAPGFPVHGSTQMTLSEPRGIEFVSRLGVERVILARELSLAEIAQIRAQTSIPVEVFVHGALCVAYSGQCLTSESLGGRSANRGQCAQACRQPYELIVDGERRDLDDQAYLLSPQDLAAWDLIPQLVSLGVCSLKIEGRLKSPQYVAAAVQTYRAALDAALAKRPFSLSRQQELDLAQSFSRGFTHGFLDGVDHQALVHGMFPKHRGVRVGTVAGITQRGVLVQLDAQWSAGLAGNGVQARGAELLPVKPGDGVVFDEGRPEQDEQGGRVYSVMHRANGPAGAACVELEFGRGAINLQAVAVGSRVWKTDDPAIRRRLEKTWAAETPAGKTPLAIRVTAGVGATLRLLVSDDAGQSVEVGWNRLLEPARQHPLTRTLLVEQIGRLGATPFVLERVELFDDAAPGQPVESIPVMIPKSVLNDLRRQAVEALQVRRIAVARQPTVNPRAVEELRAEISAGFARRTPGTPRFYVLARTMPQLLSVLDWQPEPPLARPHMVYCDFEDVRRSHEAVNCCRAAGMPVGLATPRIVKPGEDGLLAQVAQCQPDAVLVRNLAAFEFFRTRSVPPVLLGDYSLNVTNELTASLFARHDVQRMVPGYDLNLDQLQGLLAQIDPGLFEVVVHQHIPMFHMEHCVFAHTLSQGTNAHTCGRPCDRHRIELKDHVGQAHPLVADVGCRNTLFNAQPQSAAAFLPRLRAWGVQHFRVELLRESPPEVHALLDAYARVIVGRGSGPVLAKELHVLNQLGVTKGTLAFE